MKIKTMMLLKDEIERYYLCEFIFHCKRLKNSSLLYFSYEMSDYISRYSSYMKNEKNRLMLVKIYKKYLFNYFLEKC